MSEHTGFDVPGAPAGPVSPHARAKTLFSSHLDGELEDAERVWLVAHLAECAQCKGEYERFARAVGLVREEPRPRAPTTLMRKILARVKTRRRGAMAFAVENRVPVEAAIVVILAAAGAIVLTMIVLGP